MGGSKSMSSYCYFGIRNIFKQSGVLKIILEGVKFSVSMGKILL